MDWWDLLAVQETLKSLLQHRRRGNRNREVSACIPVHTARSTRAGIKDPTSTRPLLSASCCQSECLSVPHTGLLFWLSELVQKELCMVLNSKHRMSALLLIFILSSFTECLVSVQCLAMMSLYRV